MKKVQLSIIGLTYSQSRTMPCTASGEEDERLPIVIGAFEAQSIAIALEKELSLLGLSHDLFTSLALSFNII